MFFLIRNNHLFLSARGMCYLLTNYLHTLITLWSLQAFHNNFGVDRRLNYRRLNKQQAVRKSLWCSVYKNKNESYNLHSMCFYIFWSF